MRIIATFVVTLLLHGSGVAQARTMMATAGRSVALSPKAGHTAVMGSVLLGKPQTFTMFNIQAAGNISPDPDLNDAGFQLQFLICDQPDCSGDLRFPMRVLPNEDATAGAQVIATSSFAVNTHSVQPVVLDSFEQRTATGVLYLAAALKTLRVPKRSTAFTGRLDLLRIDALP